MMGYKAMLYGLNDDEDDLDKLRKLPREKFKKLPWYIRMEVKFPKLSLLFYTLLLASILFIPPLIILN